MKPKNEGGFVARINTKRKPKIRDILNKLYIFSIEWNIGVSDNSAYSSFLQTK